MGLKGTLQSDKTSRNSFIWLLILDDRCCSLKFRSYRRFWAGSSALGSPLFSFLVWRCRLWLSSSTGAVVDETTEEVISFTSKPLFMLCMFMLVCMPKGRFLECCPGGDGAWWGLIAAGRMRGGPNGFAGPVKCAAAWCCCACLGATVVTGVGAVTESCVGCCC